MGKTKCLSKDYKGEPCRFQCVDESRYCKNHQYMNEYTDEMIANLTLCSGCNKMRWLETDVRTCNNCKERGKKEREKPDPRISKK